MKKSILILLLLVSRMFDAQDTNCDCINNPNQTCYAISLDLRSEYRDAGPKQFLEFYCAKVKKVDLRPIADRTEYEKISHAKESTMWPLSKNFSWNGDNKLPYAKRLRVLLEHIWTHEYGVFEMKSNGREITSVKFLNDFPDDDFPVNFGVALPSEGTELTPLYTEANNYSIVAIELREAGQYAEALETIEKSIKMYPNEPDFYEERAKILDKMKKNGEAETARDKSIARGSNSADVYRKRAEGLMQKENYAAAAKDFEKAIELNDTDAMMYVFLMVSYGGLNEFDKMKTLAEKFDKTYEAKKEYFEAGNAAQVYLTAAGVYLYEKNYDKALKLLNKSILLDDNQPQNFNARAELFMELKNYAAAREDYKKIDEKWSNEMRPLNHIAITYYLEGKYQDAVKYHEKAIVAETFAADLEPALRQYGLTRIDMKDYDKAKTIFEKLLKKNPNDAETLMALAVMYYQQGDIENAKTHIAKAKKIAEKLIKHQNPLDLLQKEGGYFSENYQQKWNELYEKYWK